MHRWRSKHCGRKIWRGTAVTGAVLAVTLCNLGGYRPVTTHETYAAQTAREMLARGDMIVPYCFGEPRLKKPPLAYWQIAASYSLTGRIDEWSARLPSAIVGLAQVALLFAWTRRWYGNQIARWTAFIHATSIHFLTQARLAEADISLAFWVTAAIAAYACRTDQRSIGPSFAFWCATAMTILAKGPVGPALIACTVIPAAICTGQSWRLRRLMKPSAMTLGLLLAVIWPIAVVVQNPNALDIWRAESLDRFARDPNGIVRHSFYYPLALLWLMLPWTPLALAAAITNGRNRWRLCLRNRRVVLLVCWIFGPMALLSLSAGKQEHYLIPALPPCAIVAALGLRRWCAWKRSRQRTVELSATRGFRHALCCMIDRRRLAFAGSLLVVSIVGIELAVLPKVHGRRSIADWCRNLRTEGDRPAVTMLGHSVWWLSFYLHGPIQRCDTAQKLHALDALGPNAPRLVVATQEHLANLPAGFAPQLISRAPTDRQFRGTKAVVFARIVPVAPTAN